MTFLETIKIHYGAEKKSIDVKSLVLKKWGKEEIILIPFGINMNDIFGDPCYNVYKNLCFSYNTTIVTINETDLEGKRHSDNNYIKIYLEDQIITKEIINVLSGSKPVYLYLHICCLNNWVDVIRNIFTYVRDSGLYKILEEIRVCILGRYNYHQNSILKDPKIRVIKQSRNLRLYERYTLRSLCEDSFKEDFYCLYLHSKGVSNGRQHAATYKWIDELLYYNCYYFKEIIKKLKSYDVVGTKLLTETTQYPIHFSGNFWWSKSSHLNTLPKRITLLYLAPEFWICNYGKGKFLNIEHKLFIYRNNKKKISTNPPFTTFSLEHVKRKYRKHALSK